MTEAPATTDARYDDALAAVRRAIERVQGCPEAERRRLLADLGQLEQMEQKLTAGRVEIVIFGEISTGKSALINALVGEAVAAVDVQGGWTKEVWRIPWESAGYCVPGLADSQVVLIDTPGLNEVGGAARGELAQEAARQADLILFVTDSDLTDTEYSALLELAAIHKPLLVVLNKIDLYSADQRARLLTVLRDERLRGIVPPENILTTAADPREVQYVIEAADGSQREELRRPPPRVDDLKLRILEVLDEEGLALIALNAALYAADKNDRIAALRVRLRERRAQQTIASYAAFKAIAVMLNPMPVADVLGGSAVDATMVANLAHIYGLEMSRRHAGRLVSSIAKAAGWAMAGELATHGVAWIFNALTLGWGKPLTAVPQGAAAGYGSYIVGQAARYYFEQGSSWGAEGPKAVVERILAETDKDSVLSHLREEIRRTLGRNRHADDAATDAARRP